ncbi:MAG: helix-turn-helix domain-containing protein [Gemmatimonas sp.]|nr:helix-turn-helix domain-containing protein [Gemmatimonas sp.]
MDTLLDEYTDAQVAHILNERGASTGAGATFDPDSIRWVRFSARLKSLKERLLEAGMLTGKQVCAQLGMSRNTLRRWRAEGRIQARICNDNGECLYWLPEPATPPTTPTTPMNVPLVTSAAGGAV